MKDKEEMQPQDSQRFYLLRLFLPLGLPILFIAYLKRLGVFSLREPSCSPSESSTESDYGSEPSDKKDS